MKTHLLLHLLLLPIFHCILVCAEFRKAANNSVTSILVFGDSFVDPGNNNFIKTVLKADFSPYGKDFPNQIPTGRFTNGRLTTDFIASYIGLKEFVPPYLDPSFSIEELKTGVSFASSGTGYDPFTAQISNVIPIQTQIEYFKEYKKRLESVIGKEKTQDHIKKALYYINCGTNDFIINYFTVPIRRKTFTVSAYQQFILQKILQFVQDLIEEGARRITFVDIPPLGCYPIMIILFSKNVGSALLERNCIDSFTTIGKQLNDMIKKELNVMQARFANLDVKIEFASQYGPLVDMIQGKGKSAFNAVSTGCCGTGYVETAILCNSKLPVCPDASKYVYWNSVHPTEVVYYNIFQAILPNIDSLISDAL